MSRMVWGIVIFAAILVAAVALRGGSLPVVLANLEHRSVREYISEDAKTRLADEYILDLPVSGTVERIALEVGDFVEAGDVVVSMDPYELEQRIHEVDARIAQAGAHVSGVDMTKPKPEDVESAEIRVKEMQDALEVARKARKVTELNFEEALKNFDRAQGLIDAGAVSQSFLDDAETRYRSLSEGLEQSRLEESVAKKALEQAKLASKRLSGSIDDNEYLREAYEAEIKALESQRAVLRNDLKKSEVRSPVSGPILEKYVEDSRVLLAGTPLVRIGDVASIEIESDILSEEVTGIELGDPVEISGKALRGDTIMGTVTRIYPAGFEKISSLGIEQQRVKALIGFDNTDAKLRPGTSVDIRIITAESSNVLAVPDQAVFRTEGQWYVFKVRGGSAELCAVTIGLRNDEWVEIVEGLALDDVIVGELKNELEDGMRVVALD